MNGLEGGASRLAMGSSGAVPLPLVELPICSSFHDRELRPVTMPTLFKKYLLYFLMVDRILEGLGG
jgi:hypothetical protein